MQFYCVFVDLFVVLGAILSAPTVSARCGQSARNFAARRVVGGETAEPAAWPWMAWTRRFDGAFSYCGGTLINERFVLTAAHCTFDQFFKRIKLPAALFRVRLGEYNRNKPDEGETGWLRVSEIRRHPDFNPTHLYNDIALLELEQPVQFSHFIQPVCLPSVSQVNEYFLGRIATVAGWGLAKNSPWETANKVLLEVELPVVSNEECQDAYSPLRRNVADSMICAGYEEGGKDSCMGDSGGPLMVQEPRGWVQIGIVSWGKGCGSPGFPGVHTRLTEYLEWIYNNAL